MDYILTALGPTLTAIITAQIQNYVPQIAADIVVIRKLLIPTSRLINTLINAINVRQIVGNITANVNASLTLFENCLNATIAADGTAGVAPLIIGGRLPIPSIRQLATEIRQINPTVPEINKSSISGAPMFQLR